MNPLAINHAARTISFTPAGTFKVPSGADMKPVARKSTKIPAMKPKTTPARASSEAARSGMRAACPFAETSGAQAARSVTTLDGQVALLFSESRYHEQ